VSRLQERLSDARRAGEVTGADALTEASPGTEYWTIPTDDLFSALETDPQGLDEKEAALRLERFGPNEIAEVAGTPLVVKFLANFYHLFAIMLWIGGALAFVGGMPELGWAIFAVIVINAIFSFWQEFRAEKATEALKRLMPAKAHVLREGVVREILAAEIVPGDVLVLEEGDSISADARVIDEFDLRVNQATLNGESQPAKRTSSPATESFSALTEVPNLVFAGTTVAYGRGRAIAFATGMKTQFGAIATLTQSLEEDLSPLQKEMGRVTRLVAFLATGLGILFFILGYFLAGLSLAEGFIFSVGIIVANVPEGLLPTVTLSLAMGVQRMAKRNALVKKLSSVETLGSTTVICTDKTGTLTQNEMTVRNVYLPGVEVEVTGTGYDPSGELRSKDGRALDAETEARAERLLRAAALCSNARLREPDEASPAWRVIGDPTEAALLVAARKAGLDLDAEASRLPRLVEAPFDSRRKRMATAHRDGKSYVAFVKGAPKETLELCTHALSADGVEVMTPQIVDAAMAANDEFAVGGLRVLAVASRQLDSVGRADAEEIEHDLTFLGLVAMMDPPRPEVAEVVEQCCTAGIRIIMITGDYGLTAESIARRVGIVRSADLRIIIGSELEDMTVEELTSSLDSGQEVLFARVSPEHKMRIATTLKSLGHIVAMTGDGVNDAPALKAADIGVAMGTCGTDVAREAAEMVLADDNFASIVHAVEEGRAVYDNIRRFVTYIFTSNIPEIVPFILFVLFRIPLPLTVLQILAIDLGTDIVPALALGVEKPEPGVMRRSPRAPKDRLLNRRVLTRAYLFLGAFQAAACMLAYYYAYWVNGWRPGMQLADTGQLYMFATTMTFAAVVATQIGNGFAQRTNRESIFQIGLLSNKLLLAGIASEIALLAALVYIEPLARVFGFVPLSAQDWLFLACLAPTLLVADEIRKWFVRRLHPHPGGSNAGRDGGYTPPGGQLSRPCREETP